MRKIILIAEEGERHLLTDLGLSLEDAEVVVTGVGALNILHTCCDLPKDAEILNVGYAGSSNFEIGTWVEVTEVRLNHPHVTYPEPVCLLDSTAKQLNAALEPLNGVAIKQAICYTNCDFVFQSDYRDCVFDMELAFIAGLGFTHLRSLKYVSDNLSLHEYHDLTNGVE